MRSVAAEQLIAAEPEGWPADAERERLVGDWHLYQRRRGHRTSTDDVLTAWLAVRFAQGRPVARYLDLGCGIGSVLLLTAHALRPAYALGVEAQSQSAQLASRAVAELPGTPAIEILRADLRALDPERLGTFALVTGSPPYFPIGSGVLSPDPQRRACRFELRGGVEAYCEAAARVLSPEGALALVFPAAGDARVVEAARRAGLELRTRVEVPAREGREAPLLCVYELRREKGPLAMERLAIRDARGEITPAYREARASLGLPTSR